MILKFIFIRTQDVNAWGINFAMKQSHSYPINYACGWEKVHLDVILLYYLWSVQIVIWTILDYTEFILRRASDFLSLHIAIILACLQSHQGRDKAPSLKIKFVYL